MADINTITVEGNLTRDPEIRFAKSGTAVVNMGVAWSQNKRNGDGWESVPHFFDVTIFGDHGEHAAESLSKGTRVIVTGRLDYSTWTTEDNQKRSKVSILAETVSPCLRWATATVERTTGASSGPAPDGAPSPVPVEEEPF